MPGVRRIRDMSEFDHLLDPTEPVYVPPAAPPVEPPAPISEEWYRIRELEGQVAKLERENARLRKDNSDKGWALEAASQRAYQSRNTEYW